MDLQPGDLIDNKYTVEQELGRGGMGVVYAALHRELGERVALKFLHPSIAAKPDVAARFRNEARAGMRVKSHHVARVHDVGTHAGAPYIVMEHLTGSDLGAVLEERGPLSVAETTDLLLQACEAIHEAHALGIVHRDLKPSNLFVTDGADGLKVLDFGISKSPFAEQAAKTATHAVMGTPFYMSPEQLTASRSVDARSDVWALGVILYQMLGDTVPFPGSSLVEIHLAIRERPLTKLSEHCDDLPAPIDDLVVQALERDREKRLPTVLAFATRLAPFGGDVAQESLARMRRVAARASGAPPEIAERASATPPSSSWTRVAALAVVAGVVVAGGLALRHPSTSTPEITPATTASSPPAEASAIAAVPSAVVVSAVAPVPSASAVVTPSAPPQSPLAKPACTGSATPECEAACQAHARGACEALAIALVHGKGAARNPSRAAALYTSACDAGSMSACNALGALYGVGDGVSHDDDKAATLYSRACDGSYPRGCVNLGGMYFDGTGRPKDERRGAQLFRSACEAGEPLGCRNVAVAYRSGRGVEKDEGRAREYEARAAEAKATGGK